MVLAKSKNTVGLGNSLMNDRFGKGKGSDRKKISHQGAIARKGQNGETYVTNAAKEDSWVKMRSITEQAALDEFLSTAELAGTDFTAEKMSHVKIIHTDQKNPYLLSAADERAAVRKFSKNKGRLTVPRRPKWDSSTTAAQLDRMERESLLEWRRGLAELQENQDLLMTPFERNLEVWRQLWRVIERSDVVVQIVDARNPLLFRSEDLEQYVKEVDTKKTNLLLVNKADMMTEEQRSIWADYFDAQGINYRFFSAHLAKEMNEAALDESDDEELSSADKLAQEAKKIQLQEKKEDEEEWDSEEELENADNEGAGGIPLKQTSRTDILTVDELETLFLSNTARKDPKDVPEGEKERPITIGLIGYPNVGKSSTINALLGAKKVSVSATPGKTKHFQTLYLTPNIMLCDCPGLVFPNFATTKAELVASGVLPIDQLREFTGPAGLVASRIPKSFLEAVYGITINCRPLEEGGTGIPTGSEVLRAYAKARGFATTGLGQPDESRAVRYVLKDYVNGKLLFCHPPPEIDGSPAVDPAHFNRELYNRDHLPQKRRAQIEAAEGKDASLLTAQQKEVDFEDSDDEDVDLSEFIPLPESTQKSAKSANIDSNFFKASGPSSAGHLSHPFSHKYSTQGQAQAKQLSGRKARTLVALERGLDPEDIRMEGKAGKKHFKGKQAKAKGPKPKFGDD